MIFHNTKLINLGETEVSLFLFVLLVVFFPRREMQTTSRYASRTSASLGEGYSFIALRFGTCTITVPALALTTRFCNRLRAGS